MLKLIPLIFAFVDIVFSLEREVTILIEAGRRECFYQDVVKGQFIDIDYQVISGGQGRLDISFGLTSPSGSPIVFDVKEAENHHRYEAFENGDYEMCWDNTFSHFSTKTVFFELIIEREDDEEDPWNMEVPAEGETANKIFAIRVQDIQDVLNRIRGSLTQVRHLQDAIRADMARDRNVAEGNFTRVNTMAIFAITLILLVGFLQVILVRSLFDEKSLAHGMMRKLFSWCT